MTQERKSAFDANLL